MNDFLKTSLKTDTQPAWGLWDFSAEGGSCRKNTDGSVGDNASNVLLPFPKTDSQDQRVCSLYRPDASLPNLSQLPRTTRKSVCLEDAAKAEKSGQDAKDPVAGLAYFQTALANFQEAGDADGAKRILIQMKTSYEKMGNDLGVEKTKADLAFLDGNVDDALAGYRAVEKVLLDHDGGLAKETRDAVLLEMNVKISSAVQAKASLLRHDAAEKYREASQKKDTEAAHDAIVTYRDAVALMKEALWRTPSRPLTDGTLSLIIEARAAALSTSTALELQIAMLKGKGGRCHTNCHDGAPSVRLDDARFEGLIDDKPAPTMGGFREFRTYEAPKMTAQEADQWAIDFKKGLVADLRTKTDEFMSDIPAVVAAGLGEPADVDERIYNAKILAEAYVLVEEFPKARGVYETLIAELKTAGEAETDPLEKKTLTLKGVEASHQLASLYLYEYQLGKSSDHGGVPELSAKAATILDECAKTLNAFSPDAADAGATKALQRTRAFLRVQGDLMRAEIAYASAKTVDDLKFAEAILENSLFAEDVYLANIEKLPTNDPLRITFAKAHERLAQLYYLHNPKRGDAYVDLVLGARADDKDLCARMYLAKGMARLTTKGKALEGVQILRQIQLDFPGSEADRTVRSSPNIANLLGPDGVLRADVNEGDFTEAFKAALDAAVNTPPGRRLGIAALFLLVLAIIDPEPSSKVVLFTLLGATLTDSAIGVISNTDGIMSAYKTGISNVSMRETARNLCMLALDLTLWIPAGYAGKLAGSATKAGLSYGARLGARILPRLEIPFFAKQAFRAVGEIVMVGVPFVIETNVAGIAHAAGHSLLTGDDLHWNKEEALLMMAAAGSNALGDALNLGAKVSKNGAMQWMTNTAVGGTAYYGALWGIDQWSGTHFTDKGYLAVVSEQFQAMAPIHIGNKLASKSKIVRGVDGVIVKINRKGNEWLAEAKAEMAGNNGSGGPWGGYFGGFGLVPAPALAGGRLPVRFADFKAEPAGRSTPMAMVSHGEGSGAVRRPDASSTKDVFIDGKKENTLKIPEDAAKLEINDGSHGKVVIERDPATGGFRIHNHSDRSVYVGSAKGEIKPGKSGTAANASRVRLGNGWYRLNGGDGAASAGRDYRADLPKQSGDLPGKNGEIHDVTDEPTTVFSGDPTHVETAEPTFVETAPLREPLPEGEGNVPAQVGWDKNNANGGTSVGQKAARRKVASDDKAPQEETTVETPKPVVVENEFPENAYRSEIEQANETLVVTYLENPPVRSDVELTPAGVRIYVETAEARQTVLDGFKAKYRTVPAKSNLLVNMGGKGEVLYVPVEVVVEPTRTSFGSKEDPSVRSAAEAGFINIGKDAVAAFRFLEPYVGSSAVGATSVAEGRVVVRSAEARKGMETEMETQATAKGMTFHKVAGQEGMYYVTYYSGAKGARVKSSFHLSIEIDPNAPARGKLYDYGQKPKGGDETAPGL